MVGQNQRGSWLVIQEGKAGSHELVWAGDPALQKGDRIYVTPDEEGEDELVVARFVWVMRRQ